MSKGLLVVISGPSGTGKGTIIKRLLETDDSCKLSISATTRGPRIGETDKVNYFFISENDFKDMIKKDMFLEWAKVYDNYYGTPKQYVIDRLNEGYNVILEIDTQGAMNVKKKFPDGVYVFILPPSLEELKDRIIGRGTESEKDIQKRFGCAKDEIRKLPDYEYAVINDDIEDAVKRIKSIIVAEKCNIKKNKNLWRDYHVISAD